jgi:hypothetical protein
MKVKIFKVFKWDIVPLIIFVILTVVFSKIKNSEYLSVSLMYILTNYFVIKALLTMGGFFRKKDSVYDWMDALNGYDFFLRELFLSVKSKSLIDNLDQVYDSLMKYSRGDKKRLKLIRSYFRALVDERQLDIFFKMFSGVIVATIAWSINKGVILKLSEKNADSFEILGINTMFIIGMNYTTIVLLLVAGTVVVIKQFYEDKNRNKLILEILDVCIEEVD